MADFAHQTHTVSTQLTFGACSSLESPTEEMPLTLLDQTEAERRGAVCLDGSAPGFYFVPGEDTSRWVITLKGGGQCWDDEQCADMAGTIFGSNKLFPRRFGLKGVMDPDPAFNPFARFNRVLLWYCDGYAGHRPCQCHRLALASATTTLADRVSACTQHRYEFGGERTEPIHIAGRAAPIYSRGRRVIDYQMDVLLRSYNLSAATEVLIAGASSAGVAVQVSGDRLAAMLPAAAKKRLLVMSAFLRNDVHDVRRARLELHLWTPRHKHMHMHAHAHRQAGR